MPPLDETSEDVSDGRMLTTKDRMEIHRENPTCNSCHRFIDPIGLALDNYGVTGKWRIQYDEWEYFNILSGHSVVTSEDGEVINLRAGDRLILRPGALPSPVHTAES